MKKAFFLVTILILNSFIELPIADAKEAKSFISKLKDWFIQAHEEEYMNYMKSSDLKKKFRHLYIKTYGIPRDLKKIEK